MALAVARGATGDLVPSSSRRSRRPVFATTGTLRSLAWSPNGRRLLVRRAEADQWLLLSPTTAHAPITAIAGISRRFGSAPSVQGWCCS